MPDREERTGRCGDPHCPLPMDHGPHSPAGEITELRSRLREVEAERDELLEDRDGLHEALTIPSVRKALEAEIATCSAETPEEPDLCLYCRTIRAFLNLTEEEVNPERARGVLRKGDTDAR